MKFLFLVLIVNFLIPFSVHSKVYCNRIILQNDKPYSGRTVNREEQQESDFFYACSAVYRCDKNLGNKTTLAELNECKQEEDFEE
jgi:hypothetical protein